MKATSGNLRLDHSYELLDTTYAGKYSESELTAICFQCENCGKGIANIATVKGSVDGREYRIGLDCAATLTGILPDKVKQAKKDMAREAKFRKWIVTELIYWFEIEGVAYLCDVNPVEREITGQYDVHYHWRCKVSAYAAVLPQDKKYILQPTEIKNPYEWNPEREVQFYKLTKQQEQI